VRRSTVPVILLVVVASACSEPTAITITIAPASVSLDAIGATQQLTATLTDQRNKPVTGVIVVWASANEGVATVSESGLVTAVANGTTEVTATAGGSSQPVNVTVAQAPDSLIKVSGDGQSGAAGTPMAESLVVRVVDRLDQPVAGHTMAFAATGGGIVSPTSVVTGASGRAAARWTLGNTPGPQSASASTSVPAPGSPATFTATAVAATMQVHAGDGQTGVVGYAANVRPAVQIVDPNNQPVPGVPVTFTVSAGGGSISGAIQVSGPDGVARVTRWVLGTAPGVNALIATAAGTAVAGNPQTFTATGATAAFDIDLRNLSTLTSPQQAAFNSAATRWELLIFGDLAPISLNAPAATCGANAPAVNETIDDLVIFVTVEPIDGVGGTLGAAGPCYIRSAGKLPILGRMRFDTDDLSQLEMSGRLGDVILHEMGHVLGFGTLWNDLGFLKDPSLPSSPGAPTHFDGPNAIAEFNQAGGTSFAGSKVPVENSQGGAGTRDAHWRESVLDEELMTGFIEALGANPLSRISVASLWDLGYLVNLDPSDEYSKVFAGPPSLAPAAGGQIWLGDDIARGPIYVVSAGGGVVGVHRR
jgi:hypothetical protein